MTTTRKNLYKTFNTYSGTVYVFANSAAVAAMKVDKFNKAEAKKDGYEYEPVSTVERLIGLVVV